MDIKLSTVYFYATENGYIGAGPLGALLPPGDQIILEYSVDEGRTWMPICAGLKGGVGLRYRIRRTYNHNIAETPRIEELIKERDMLKAKLAKICEVME
jgi:hypothetical protein